MDCDRFAATLEGLAAGWTNRDYESVAAYFADTLYYADPLNYRFCDNASLLAFFREDYGKPQSCSFHNSIFDEESQTGVAEYTYEGSFIYHGTVWIEFESDKITSWREYQHRSEKDWEEFWETNERDRS